MATLLEDTFEYKDRLGVLVSCDGFFDIEMSDEEWDTDYGFDDVRETALQLLSEVKANPPAHVSGQIVWGLDYLGDNVLRVYPADTVY